MRTSPLIFVLGAVLVACSSDEPEAEPWRPVDPSETFAGHTLEEWAVEWSRWAHGVTSCDNAMTDVDGSWCGQDQPVDGPAWFMTFSVTKSPRTRCHVPRGKAIVVPVMMVYNDNAGVDPPDPDTAVEGWVRDVFESSRDLRLRVDDVDISMRARGVGPVQHSYYVPPAPNYYTCQTIETVSDTVVEPSFVAGYLAVFPPPPAGQHRIEYSAVYTADGVNDQLSGTTVFTVDE